MIDLGKQNVLGIRVDAVDYEAAVERIAVAAHDRRPYAVSALAVHGLMTGVLDRAHRYRLNQFDLLTPDGQPVRWALGWLHGAKLVDRVYGPRLTLEVCKRAEQDGLSIFLFGGSEPLLEKLRSQLAERFPRLKIAGSTASRFRRLTPMERDEAVATIRNSGAAITLVGLGCPRQEVFAYEFRDALSMPVLAVGAAFNFIAGDLAQAPKYLQDRGLEWLYRLGKEPRRLWRRYLLLNPLYVWLLLLQICRVRSFDPTDADPPLEQVLYG
jgi:N-acetylglucosaminyldiphosphoundecaprenol N-acetyl-beta-D-mannosaminyltransferase